MALCQYHEIGEGFCDILLDSQSNWPEWPPVLTNSSTGNFVYPSGDYYDSDRLIGVPANTALDLSCPWTRFLENDFDQFITAEWV